LSHWYTLDLSFPDTLEWHVIAGLVTTFVEAPLQIQQNIQFPDVMLQQCQNQNIPVTGNAANHTESNRGLLDLTGEPSAPPPLPAGFTAKGYGAMAGCCIAAVMGMVTIVWYGLTDSPKEDYSAQSGRSSRSDPIFVGQPAGHSE
jgi:iron transport multicopper oxidase